MAAVILTSRVVRAYACLVLAYAGIGIGTPLKSGNSRIYCGFFASDTSLWWVGLGSRKAGRCSSGSSNLARPATRIGTRRSRIYPATRVLP